MDEKLALIGCW